MEEYVIMKGTITIDLVSKGATPVHLGATPAHLEGKIDHDYGDSETLIDIQSTRGKFSPNIFPLTADSVISEIIDYASDHQILDYEIIVTLKKEKK